MPSNLRYLLQPDRVSDLVRTEREQPGIKQHPGHSLSLYFTSMGSILPGAAFCGISDTCILGIPFRDVPFPAFGHESQRSLRIPENRCRHPADTPGKARSRCRCLSAGQAAPQDAHAAFRSWYALSISGLPSTVRANRFSL